MQCQLALAPNVHVRKKSVVAMDKLSLEFIQNVNSILVKNQKMKISKISFIVP